MFRSMWNYDYVTAIGYTYSNISSFIRNALLLLGLNDFLIFYLLIYRIILLLFILLLFLI